MTKKTEKLPDLEASLTEITSIIDAMEHDELNLEQSLKHFERGIMLIKHCQKTLSTAEQKVNILLQQNGKESLAAYDTDTEGDDTDENDDH